MGIACVTSTFRVKAVKDTIVSHRIDSGFSTRVGEEVSTWPDAIHVAIHVEVSSPGTQPPRQSEAELHGAISVQRRPRIQHEADTTDVRAGCREHHGRRNLCPAG